VNKLHSQGITTSSEIAGLLGIGGTSVYRALGSWAKVRFRPKADIGIFCLPNGLKTLRLR
jgi:hypothetical protein